MDTGDVIDVDREAFVVISIIKDIKVLDMKALYEFSGEDDFEFPVPPKKNSGKDIVKQFRDILT